MLWNSATDLVRVPLFVYEKLTCFCSKEFFMIKRCSFPALAGTASRATFLLLCCFSLMLASCAGKEGASSSPSSKPGPSVSPTEKRLAYDIVLNVPTSYTVATMLSPDAASKSSLDSRRQAGERVLLFEAAGAPSQRGIDPMVAVFLVNQEGTFMPQEFASQIKPEELAAISQELLAREKAEAKKNKKPAGLLDLQINRDTINGHTAIVQRMLVAGPDGKPARLINWDIYLPNGAGIAVKSVCDQEVPGAETEIVNIARSIRAQ